MIDRWKVWPPDDEWVPFALPWVEGRCIPEKRMSLKDGKWIIESRYPKPSEETDDDEPEIDMIPVVRCKDCKYGRDYIDGKFYCDHDIFENDTGMHSPDWFCADGERRTDDA